MSVYIVVKGAIRYGSVLAMDEAMSYLSHAGFSAMQGSYKWPQLRTERGAALKKKTILPEQKLIIFPFDSYRDLDLNKLLKGSVASHLRVSCNAFGSIREIVNGTTTVSVNEQQALCAMLKVPKKVQKTGGLELEDVLVSKRQRWVSGCPLLP